MRTETIRKQYATFCGDENLLAIFPVNGGKIKLKGRDEIEDFIKQMLEFCYEISRIHAMGQALDNDTDFDYPIFYETYSGTEIQEGRILKIIAPKSGAITLKDRKSADNFIDELQCQCDMTFGTSGS